MLLNNIWGYGELFGFSAIDGPNRYYQDFVATTTHEKIGFRFEMEEWIKIYFPFTGDIKFKAVLSDLVEADTNLGHFVITFIDNDTLVGYSPILPKITFEKHTKHLMNYNIQVTTNGKEFIGLNYKYENNQYRFVIHHSFKSDEARSIANYYMGADFEKAIQSKYDYFKTLPECKNKKYEQLYYKSLQVNKVNVKSPEGKIQMLWTTPDRVPHRNMWLWDSVFHALAMVDYNPELAKTAIKAVLSQAWDTGFIPHMMNPTDSSDVTQPQVLAWGVWNVYLKTKDINFLKESVQIIENFLNWTIENRDKNHNGLLEWFREPQIKICRCGESGLDNSPRFDSDLDQDHVDFSTWLANDSKFLSYIFNELGNAEKASYWMKKYETTKDAMNKILWNDKYNVYQDKAFDNTFAEVITPFNFFPMLAGIPSKEQASKMVEVLTNPKYIWGKVPLATIEKGHPTYSTDMWRGGVWMNVNFFVIKGLKEYGYTELAEKLTESTLEMINKWYLQTGVIFEFFDPEDKVSPFYCERKGKQPKVPDWRKHVHSIADYNWSACFALMLIQGNNY